MKPGIAGGRHPEPAPYLAFTPLLALSLFLLSASVVALQIVLMRILSFTRYHHFSYFIIGTALMGFGVSGTFLAFTQKYLKKHPASFMMLLFFLSTVSIPLCLFIAEKLPVDIQYVFLDKGQALLLVWYDLLIFVPFFFGACAIGAMLAYFSDRAGVVYAVNLAGSGAGGAAALLLTTLVAPALLPGSVSLIAFASLFMLFSGLLLQGEKGTEGLLMRTPAMYVCLLAAGLGVPLLFFSFTPQLKPDQYKLLSHLKRLELQGDAVRLYTRFGPRGQVDVYEAGSLHQTIFAGLGLDCAPPPQAALLVDGSMAGTVFAIHSADQARILDFTAQSLPYRLFGKGARVLLLGETGGVNAWLALRFGAAEVTIVQGNPQLNELMQKELAPRSGNLYGRKEVRVITEEPRLFLDRFNRLERTKEHFDIIQIVAAEGLSAGVSGLQSLHEDYLLTVEALTSCLNRLSERGFLSLTRGIQSPPRDNIKIFASFAAALEARGIREPGKHLLQGRNYLAVNTIASAGQADANLIAKYQEALLFLQMDGEYYEGISQTGLNRFNIAEGPKGTPFSWYHAAALLVLSSKRQAFFDDWAYHIVPATDDRPYFYDFFKWRSVKQFYESFGPLWLDRLETGYAILVFTFATTSLAALAFIVAPLILLRTGMKKERHKAAVAVYFFAIGTGFMFVEMVLTQKFIKYLGDPVFSVTAVVMSLLLFAGAGSMYGGMRGRSNAANIGAGAAAVVLMCLCLLLGLDRLLDLLSSLPQAGRFLTAVAVPAPLSFFMGWMFPCGLKALDAQGGRLIAWAWGINGFASVCATPLSVMLSMSLGFNAVLMSAMVLYGISAWAGSMLADTVPPRSNQAAQAGTSA